MANLREVVLKCACCGRNFPHRQPVSFFSDSVDLDGNPHEPAVYTTAAVCPFCQFVNGRPGPAVDDALRSYIRSPEYRLMPFEIEDPAFIALSRQAAIGDFVKDSFLAGRAQLALSWRLQDLEKDPSPSQKKAIGYLGDYLQDHYDPDLALIVCDLLRQTGDFEEAADSLASLEPFLQREDQLRMAAFERKLIALRDAKPHRRKEALT